jgi:uncharacterized protein (TIGR02270 family)
MPLRESKIRWDIVEEHLDEADFLYNQWESALRSPRYNLPEIAEGPEARLLAHLDGLVVMGPRIAQEKLIPALGEGSPGRAFAAAFALLEGGRPEDLEAVLGGFASDDVAVRGALRRALSVAKNPGVGGVLAARASKSSAAQVDLLDALAALRVDPGFALEPLMNTRDPLNEAACLRLARYFPARLNPLGVQRALTSPAGAVRAAALAASLISGERNAVAACEATVREGGPGFRTAALGLALSGEERAVSTLVAAQRDPKLAPDATFALGFTGRASAADALVGALDDDALAPLAGDGLSAITGLVVARQFAKPPPAWDGGFAEDEPAPSGPEADLPVPDAETVAVWWTGMRPKLDPAQRWLRGQRWSAEGLLRELEGGPASRREGLALELAVRSKGQMQIAWDALAARQWRELKEARAGIARISARG